MQKNFLKKFLNSILQWIWFMISSSAFRPNQIPLSRSLSQETNKWYLQPYEHYHLQHTHTTNIINNCLYYNRVSKFQFLSVQRKKNLKPNFLHPLSLFLSPVLHGSSFFFLPRRPNTLFDSTLQTHLRGITWKLRCPYHELHGPSSHLQASYVESHFSRCFMGWFRLGIEAAL